MLKSKNRIANCMKISLCILLIALHFQQVFCSYELLQVSQPLIQHFFFFKQQQKKVTRAHFEWYAPRHCRSPLHHHRHQANSV